MDPKVTKTVEQGVTLSMSFPLVHVVDREKPDMMKPNDIETAHARKKIRVSVDEAAPDDRSELDKYVVRSNFELHSATSRAAYDALYESEDDVGVRDMKGSEHVSRGSFGRWTRDEHEAFLRGLKEYGREWKKVADLIPTRSSAQIRSHAQKYFAKLSKEGIAHPLSIDTDNNGRALSADQELSRGGLSSSVLAKIDQITRDPSGVQREVELTLKKLRERYKQLQSELERKTRKHHARSHVGASSCSHSHALYSPLAGPATAALKLECDIPESEFDLGAISRWTATEADAPVPSSIDVIQTCSSLSSKESVLIECDSSYRELENEELIALEVLRGGLPISFPAFTAAKCESHTLT